MEILNLMQCTELGGTERAALQFMTGLQQRRHVCKVISLNPLGRMAPLLHKHGIPSEGVSYRGVGGVLTMPSLHSRLKRHTCDGLMMTGPNLMAMLTLGDVGGRRRLLAVHHHHTGEKPSWQWQLIYHVAHSRFRAISFPSEFLRKEAEALYPSLVGKTHTIRNPIEVPDPPTQEQRWAARAVLGVPQQAKVLGNAGWLIPRKRFDVFLRVAARVAKHEQALLCIIAGDGPERSRLEQLSDQLGLAGRVRWLGWQLDMQTFYRSLDCLLFNSDREALSMTALEALSHGVPLVSSVRCGGLSEIITDGEHGILLDDHHEGKLAAGVMRSFGPDGARLAAAGRIQVGRCCDTAKAVSSVEALLA
jgi:glycosyltransferase involved in cell wall biosynthesis